MHILMERGMSIVTVGNKSWCKRIKESLQHDSEYKCYGERCAELESCLCKRLCPFFHKMEGPWVYGWKMEMMKGGTIPHKETCTELHKAKQ
jgi:hypothetical protein